MSREIRPDVDREWPAPAPEPAEERTHPDRTPGEYLLELGADSEGGETE